MKDVPMLVPLTTEFAKLPRIVLCMPVSTCTAERSFSSLRRLKSYLRSTMTQEWFNHIAVTSCHSEKLDSNQLLDEFIKKAPVCMNVFSLHNATQPQYNDAAHLSMLILMKFTIYGEN